MPSTENNKLNISNYINNSPLEYRQITQRIEFLRYMKVNSSFPNDDLIIDLSSNLVKLEDGFGLFEYIMRDKAYSKEHLKEVFDFTLELYLDSKEMSNYNAIAMNGFIRSYNSNFNTVYDEIIYYTQKLKLDKSGFYYTPKGALKFNANIFVEYFHERVDLVTLPNGIYAVYNKSGYYELVDDIIIAKIIMYLMNDVIENVWTRTFEQEALRALLLKTPRVNKLNPYRDFLNLENGMLNLNTMELEDYSPSLLSTIRIAAKYNKDATCPRFIQFMQEITCDNKELEMVIQELLGYVLTAETKAEKGFFFHGRGANGKSVLSKVIEKLVGKQNITNIPLRQFSSKFGLETLIDKTVNIANENELDDKKMNTEALKSIISGDQIHISVKYKKGIDYQPFAKLIFLTNMLPDTNDNTYGFYRKIMIIPFDASFEGDEADKDLIYKLEKELDGILLYALEGLKRLEDNNYSFTECSVIEEIMQKYETEQNPVITFFNEIMEVGESFDVSKKDVVEGFKRWAIENGREDYAKISNLKFWKLFKLVVASKGLEYKEKKIQGFHYLKGIGMKAFEQPLDELEVIL